MNTFTVYFRNVTDVGVEVEAANYEEAIRNAFDSPRMPGSLCHSCSRDRNDGDWEESSVLDANGELVWEESQ